MNWYLEALKKYAQFKGRSRRSEFWWFAAVNNLVLLMLVVVENSGLLAALYLLAVLIPGSAVQVRRLHDTGRSAWWLLLSLVPIIGGAVLIVFALQDSRPGANKYGPNPKLAGVLDDVQPQQAEEPPPAATGQIAGPRRAGPTRWS
ncbi:MAG: DUF805 domain-containing protein [Proteobacteria bacterium]|nr:DUF805 domain-containing protein [Pseudomonadota bacterium]